MQVNVECGLEIFGDYVFFMDVSSGPLIGTACKKGREAR